MKNPSKTAFAMLGVLFLSATACGGGGVEGTTYANNGSVVKIEFKSDGKAFVAMGPMSQACTYSQKGKTVTLVCEGDTTDLTIEDDALNGPPDGLMARLTKQKE